MWAGRGRAGISHLLFGHSATFANGAEPCGDWHLPPLSDEVDSGPHQEYNEGHLKQDSSSRRDDDRP